ncbi:hypothetical protein CTI12_AA473460 [Artemisia annua]|uniref:Uncharacterized protein n=1 Tax=Artemisia annua TaxID=35608 RepID=A0A2U1LG42_ARTAN|nr:hypothetical protein CTI12_AA473460 [Artemisia annua]
MDRYKLPAAKRCRKQLHNNCLMFEHLVDQSAIFEPKSELVIIRKVSRLYDGETLAWIMAIDVSFLLDFLDAYTIQKRSITRVTSRMSYHFYFSCRKFAHNAILRDFDMLENQIPIFLLEKMLEVKFLFSSSEYAKTSLASTLLGLYKELSPFRVLDHENNISPSNEHCTHGDKQVSNVISLRKHPLMEEISIPSVTNIVKDGIRFSPSSGGIFTPCFDENLSTFFLSFDVNTDLMLRNLVAYEVIEDVNKVYGRSWRVRIGKFIKVFMCSVHGSFLHLLQLF